MPEIEQPTTTTGVNLPAPMTQMREQLPALLQSHLPWMQEKYDKANELLDSITPPKDDEELEDAIARLAAVSKVYGAISDKRKEMTEITDAFKEAVMMYERPFDTKSGAKSKYQEKRKYIEEYQQRKLDERRKLELEAANRKELENLKVDLRARILQALNDNLIDTKKRADDYARNLFATLELANFDTHADQFRKQKPKLKPETYDKCFAYKTHFEIVSKIDQINNAELGVFIKALKEEESYDKWNTAIQEAVAPVLNEWRARIPDLKEELIQKSKASAEEKARLEEERKKRDDEERAKKQKEIDDEAFIKSAAIQEQATTDKIGNEFQAQAATQNMADGGNVKLVLKFTDPKLIPKALMNIIYHCMAHSDFGGIQKRDAKKKLMVDDKGRPVYIDEVQKWIDFYLKNCNANVEGTQVFEDSKVTIRG